MDRKEELRLASLKRMEAARKRQAAEYHRRWYEKHKEEHLAKVKNGRRKTGNATLPISENIIGSAAKRRRGGMRKWTAEELAEMAAADREIEETFRLSQEDIDLSRRMDREAKDDRKDNRERKVAAQQKAYREANREKVAAQQRAWYEANREKYNAYQRGYKRRKRKEGKCAEVDE